MIENDFAYFYLTCSALTIDIYVSLYFMFVKQDKRREKQKKEERKTKYSFLDFCEFKEVKSKSKSKT